MNSEAIGGRMADLSGTLTYDPSVWSATEVGALVLLGMAAVSAAIAFWHALSWKD